MKRLLIFLFLSVRIFIFSQEQTQAHELNHYKLFVTLENAPFDSLYLFDYTKNRELFFVGTKLNKYTWEITIPDSIVRDSENMSLKVSKYNIMNNSSREVRFITEKDGKRNIIVNIGMEDKDNYIHGTYIKQTIFPDEYMSVRIENKDSIIVGNIIEEDFNLILQNDNSDITIRAQEPLFSWFSNLNDENTSYDEYLARYIEISKKHPDSRFLMCNLSCMLNRYKSKNDVQSIYHNLSNKHKNTFWAKNIERFLNTKFQNTYLPTSDKKTYEYIVQDSTKYNLIIFTASWCRPCIEEIPILKEIYKDLNKNLILTYISIDEDKNTKNFQKLTCEKQIPWRVLYAFKNIQQIKEKYFVDGIPHCSLIYPNGDMEKIDVRNDEQRKRLYLLCDNNCLIHSTLFK